LNQSFSAKGSYRHTKKFAFMNDIDIAITKLLSGEPVAFPTETVYGLGADCTQDQAVEKIFSLKGRPSFNPLIIHVANLESALKYGEFNPSALRLAQAFWPGPLTLVIPLRPGTNVSQRVTAGLQTIGIRVPNHPVALELLRQYPNPIAAPSANKSGYISPTKHEHVRNEFHEDVFIIPGDQSCIGLESTIVDCSEDDVAILRPGFITKADIETLLKIAVSEKSSTEAIKAPGQLKHHYSPSLPVRLNATHVFPNEALLTFGQCELTADVMLNLSPSGNLDEAAANLFDFLRTLDNPNSKVAQIAVAPIPNTGVGIAINERLQRAAAPKSD
jgi:L-threonylcarbamoyladenylate synthase